MRAGFWFFVVLALLPAAPWATANTPKLLYLGAAYDPQDLLNNPTRLQELPFNGYMFLGQSTPGAGQLSQLISTSVFSTNTLSASNFSGFVSRAQQLNQAAPAHLTDNFLRVTMLPGNLAPGANPNTPPGSFDPVSVWIDDTAFDRVLGNVRVAAQVARDAGLKGLSFDLEPYGGDVWSFDLQQDAQQQGLTMDQTRAIVRQRGQQVMQAIQSEFADQTLLFLYTYHPQDGMSTSFLDGMYDVVDERTKMVDGYEIYNARTTEDFKRGYSQVHNFNPAISESPINYSQSTTAGNAIYLESAGWNSGTGQSPELTPAVWKNTLKNALRVTDEYTWVFNQADVTQNHPNWITGANFDGVAYDQATREAIAESQWNLKVYQDGVNGYSGTRDTFITGPSAVAVDRNAGANNGVVAGQANASFQYQTLIKFTDLSLPANLEVFNARLVLHISGIGATVFDPTATKQGIQMSVQGLLQDFEEGDNPDTLADAGETTFNYLRFDQQSWNLSGAVAESGEYVYDDSADRYSISDDTLSGLVTLGQHVVFDVTESFVNQLQNGKEYGWIISTSGGGANNYLIFGSREDPNLAFRPQLQITYAATDGSALIGDFNNDGTVDAADYVVWRDKVGSNNPLPNDGGASLPVGQAHNNLWRSKFGTSNSGTSGANVPEPQTLLLTVLWLVGLTVYGQRQCGKWILPKWKCLCG